MKHISQKLLIFCLILTLLPFSVEASTEQDNVIKIAKSYLGVPYKSAGATPNGFDCSGFTYYVFTQVGKNLPRTSASQYTVGTTVSKSNLQPGDLVFFEKTMNKSGITHVGIYVGSNEFISATSSKGIKIDSLSSTYWGPKYVGAKRVLEDVKFSDLKNDHPAYDAVLSLSEQAIIQGFEDNTFRPETLVTRGQAAAIINRVLKIEPEHLNVFPDVPATSRFAKDIAAIKEAGIINGFNDGKYRPDAYMTRAEMAYIVHGAFDLGNKGIKIANNNYTDISSGYWAYDAIVTLSHIDTTTLFDGNKYNTTEEATRVFFAAAIYNAKNSKK